MLNDTHQAFLRVSRAKDATEALSLFGLRAGNDAWAFAYAAARLAGGVIRSSGSDEGLEAHAWALNLPFQGATSYNSRLNKMVTPKPAPAREPDYEWQRKWVRTLAAMPEDWPLWGKLLAEAEEAEKAEAAAKASAKAPTDHTYDLGDWLEY